MLDSFVLYLKNVVTSKECFCLQVFAIDSFIHCQVFPCSMHSFHYFSAALSFKFYFPRLLFSVALRVSKTGALIVFFYSAFHFTALRSRSNLQLLYFNTLTLFFCELNVNGLSFLRASVTDSESRND